MGLDEEQGKVLSDLKRKRGVIKAALTRVQTFITKFDPVEQAVSLIGFRQEELPLINRKFDDIQSQIELIDVDDIEGAEAERDKFETDYFAVRSQIQEIMDHEKAMNTSVHNTSHSNSVNLNRTQLAPIPLPKFSGDIQDWASFYDIFKAMVHNEDGYSAAQKFYYLRSCLEGAALDLVRSTPICDGNYEVVMQMLKQRYDNRSLAIQSHIRSILDCPFMGVSSSGTLQKLYANVTTHVAALRALDQPVEHWDAWLVTIVTSRLDKDTAHGWLLRQRNTSLPKYSELESFLASRCVAMEGSENLSKCNGSATSASFKRNSTAEKRSLLVATEIEPCLCCSGAHKLFNCERFKGLSVGDRLTFARKSTLCFNCLSPRHMSNTCRSMYTCRECKQKHNTLLHMEKVKEPAKSREIASKMSNNVELTAEGSNATSLLVGAVNGHVFLATATVYVQDKFGCQHECRLVLDSGSQLNFISESLASRLGLPLKRTSLPVSGIGANQVYASSSGELQIRSRSTNYKLDLECYVLPNIVADLAASPVPTEGWNIPEELSCQLADPCFYKRRTVDLLIGGGAFFDILGIERKPLGIGALWIQDSRFGWIITGELESTCLVGVSSMGRSLEEEWMNSIKDENETYNSLSKGNKKSLEAQKAVDHFAATAKRNAEGRFVLRLPIKEEISDLGDTFGMAKSRFLNVERKLQRDDVLRLEYIKFMNEYLQMGHMQQIIEKEIPKRNCYLPHHAVIKASSLTTKTRVVFDASAKSSSGLSLNDVLLCGPAIQDDVFTILCRFRMHLHVITADVEKMYRQVEIAKEDCDLQRIVWRASPTEKLNSYRLMTVTYGTAPASFMATQCLVSLSEEFKHKFPRSAKAIRCDFYMDDLMTGCDDEEDCLSLQREITSMLDSAKFPLRKWCSSSKYIRERIGEDNNDSLFVLKMGDDDMVKSLGLCWKPVMDELRFNGVVSLKCNNLTKRAILSDLNRVFDPLGFLTPVLITGKIFLQQLWQMKANWDSILPKEVQTKWNSFYDDLEKLRLISIPRSVKVKPRGTVEMHGFCDASIEAYGACIYVRSRDEKGQYYSRLLCSKSRVASLKGATIPRLELCGALLLSQLVAKVADSWNIAIKEFHLWTDSIIVLGWLNCQGNRLKTYVANRINQILECTDSTQWNHVRTNENPADVISRGIGTHGLMNSQLWWKGPDWLERQYKDWVPSLVQINEDSLPDQRSIKLALLVTEPSKDLINLKSDWNQIVRSTAWLSLFVDYLRNKGVIQAQRYLTVTQLKRAKLILIKRVQAECFSKEISALKNGEEVPRSSKIRNLYPFIRDGILLVGGRIQNASVRESQKHPMVLPASHKVTRLIFENCHQELLHCGPQALLAEVRRMYWPLRGRIMARSVTSRCIQCIKVKPKFFVPLMAPLPRDRVQCSRPFTITGVDFAGPIVIRSGIRRVTGVKTWIAVFVCFSTRAIHLEAVEDLTSAAFIACLRRFMSRRGKCKRIYSDNGTNFIGAQKELSGYMEKIDKRMEGEGIEWRFNPPSAPHFGGLWENAVKSTKFHLTRIMKDARLTLGELSTLLCQIEACVNSRPMTPISSDPSDLEALTPAHFLIGGPMFLPPEKDLTETSPNGIRRWKRVQYLMQTFWKRWQSEYLPQCQVRGKWLARTRPMAIDDVVIIKGESSHPTKWKLGRVVQLHPGKDEIIRVVTLRTASGVEMRRPTAKLCRLPVQDDGETVENQDFQRGENVDAE